MSRDTLDVTFTNGSPTATHSAENSPVAVAGAVTQEGLW
jgi:hypothetical protein